MLKPAWNGITILDTSLRYALLEFALPGYAAGGIAIMAPKGSHLLHAFNSVLPTILGSTEYNDLCTKYSIDTCFVNVDPTSLADLTEAPTVPEKERVYRLAIGLDFAPLDFLGAQSIGQPGFPIEGFSNEVALMVCAAAGMYDFIL